MPIGTKTAMKQPPPRSAVDAPRAAGPQGRHAAQPGFAAPLRRPLRVRSRRRAGRRGRSIPHARACAHPPTLEGCSCSGGVSLMLALAAPAVAVGPGRCSRSRHRPAVGRGSCRDKKHEHHIKSVAAGAGATHTWSCPADINCVQRGELAVDSEGLPQATQQQQQQSSSSSSGAAAAARPPGAVTPLPC